MKHDIRKLTKGVDEALARTDNPLHRAILLNYRRHQILEVSGRYEEIFVPEMTVEEPEYVIFGGFNKAGEVRLKGWDTIKNHYKGIVERNVSVMSRSRDSSTGCVSVW